MSNGEHANDPCACGHTRASHSAVTGCAKCGCLEFRRPQSLEYEPKYSDAELRRHAGFLLESSKEVLPRDLHALIIIVDGSDPRANRRFRTRAVSYLKPEFHEEVLRAAAHQAQDSQIIAPSKHLVMRVESGHYGSRGKAIDTRVAHGGANGKARKG